MNYADLRLGTWYPQGGMYKIADAFRIIAEEQGVKFYYNSPVDKFEYSGDKIKGVYSNGELHHVDHVVAGADYHHIDKHVLDSQYSNYDEAYWGLQKDGTIKSSDISWCIKEGKEY